MEYAPKTECEREREANATVSDSVWNLTEQHKLVAAAIASGGRDGANSANGNARTAVCCVFVLQYRGFLLRSCCVLVEVRDCTGVIRLFGISVALIMQGEEVCFKKMILC